MSTEREELRMAAKAAGHWSDEFNCPDKLPHLGWNPLTNDGDALRLAVNLCLLVNVGEFFSYATNGAHDGEEIHNGDPYAATRRAIVLAAAEVGRAMP